MRRILFLTLSIVFLLSAREGHAQSPPGINYQGIARNPDGKPLAQKDIAIRINILKDGANGEVEYSEVHSLKTNSFGLFTLVIGTGSAETGDFAFISWAIGNKWLRVEMDPDGGNTFQLMGSQQFMSVPYAFYSRYAGNSTLTAGQGIAIENDVVHNTGDSDASTTNELNQSMSLGVDNVLRITDAGGTKEADLSTLITPGREPQDLQLSSNKLKVTGNPIATEIDLAPYLDNTDNQDLTLSANVLNLTNDATPVNLSPYLDNTDSQNLSLSGTTLVISGGTGVDLAAFRQDLSRTGNTLSLTNDATTVDLSPYLDNTDSQNLSLAGTTLNISNGTGVSLSSLRQDLSSSASGTTRTINITSGASTNIDVADNDNNTSNEIQDLNRSGNTLTLSSDATPVDLTPYLDDTDEQRLTLSGTSLSIDRGNSVNLAAFMDDTDDQDLTLNGATHSLSLSGDPTPVNLAPYLDNTDDQNLSLLQTGNTRTISIENGVGVSFSVADNDSDASNELQSLTYNSGTKALSISTGNSVTISETQNLNLVLMQGNDANGQRITNIGAPTANTDAVTKQYVDNGTAAINARLSANYAFKTGFTFTALLALSEVTLPLAGESFDDFDVVGTSGFTAQAAGIYFFVLDGTTTGITPAGVNLLYNGTNYPVTRSGNQFNSTFMFRLTAGQTVSVVATGVGIGASVTGQFYGYKLP